MKKVKSLLCLLLVAFSLFSFVNLGILPVFGLTYIYDEFDDINDWVTYGTVSASSTYYVSSPTSLKLSANGANQDHWAYQNFVCDRYSIRIEAQVRIFISDDDWDASRNVWGVTYNSGASVIWYCLIGAQYVSGTKFTFAHWNVNTRTAYNTTQFNQNEWYNVTTTISLLSDTMTTYVNGVPVITDTTARANACPARFMTLVHTDDGGGIGAIYMDDLTVEDYYPSDEFYATLDADLENIDEYADWVFTDWKYYDFIVTGHNVPCDNLSIAFWVPTGEEDIGCGILTDGDEWTFLSDMTYESREGEPIKIKSGTWSFDSETNETVATFPIWFESRILDVWNPDDCVDVYYAYDGGDWFLLEEDFFRIYSKGGFNINGYTVNDASFLDEGLPFSFHVENNSWIYNEIWYRDLQHVKMLPEVSAYTGYGNFSIYYGIEYSLGEGEWLTGWYLKIEPYAICYGPEVWVNMTVSLYNKDGSQVSDVVYMFYHGSPNGDGDLTSWKMWIDLWFSSDNASSVGVARINAYEYPMKDSADAWLRWLSNNWGVMDDVKKELLYSTNLLDGDGEVISSKRIQMVKVFSYLVVANTQQEQIVEIKNLNVFDVTRSSRLPLEGIETPVFDETKTPTMSNTGLLGAIWSALSGFGNWISENIIFGGLNLWGTFVNFLDTIAGWFGAPKFFTNLFTWIGEVLAYLSNSFTYTIELMVEFFNLIGELLGGFVSLLSDVVTSFVATISSMADALGGALGWGGNVWDTLGIATWIQVAIVFYSIYLIILWDEHNSLDPVVKQLGWIFGIASWLFHLFISIIQVLFRAVGTLIESIPVAE